MQDYQKDERYQVYMSLILLRTRSKQIRNEVFKRCKNDSFFRLYEKTMGLEAGSLNAPETVEIYEFWMSNLIGSLVSFLEGRSKKKRQILRADPFALPYCVGEDKTEPTPEMMACRGILFDTVLKIVIDVLSYLDDRTPDRSVDC